LKEYVLDANAVMWFLRGGDTRNTVTVRNLFELARNGHAAIFISAINLGEVFYVIRKTHTEATAHSDR